ncbi:UdgX family uracil-DNA binding protein [Rhizobacter sp. SG703]|uniref:UdgX family uracil-DNA binding protein n=1 Tax=Rhizobacter sp. SG703 TaxID=2587140 RepID=UPI0018422A83|nr:UdgX family uracil-DNA binding protein [Rhizobacter sp. SG703]NKI92475.1 DNA polymerase [Rhizobacter sp. SG703]
MPKAPGASGDASHDKAARALARLRRSAATCRECPLGERATQTVWGEGRPNARWMFVGEQPGDKEDREGHPFIGPAGRLLDQALDELDWPRESLYVTNAVKHFKFEMRGKVRKHKTPAQLEIIACHHWLESEIATVRPEMLVALGGTAARALLGRAVKVLSERGRWLLREDGLPVLVTLHPAALLRGEPAQREQAVRAWVADLRRAQRGPAAGTPG